MKVIFQEGDGEVIAEIVTGSFELEMMLLKFNETDRSWFQKIGDFWYEEDGYLNPPPVHIQPFQEAANDG